MVAQHSLHDTIFSVRQRLQLVASHTGEKRDERHSKNKFSGSHAMGAAQNIAKYEFHCVAAMITNSSKS